MTSRSAPRIYFLTLGCPKNEVDSDRMMASVAASSYALAEEPDDADIVVVNTCSFIQEATEESIAAILEVASDWLPVREDRKLVVTGCLPSRYGRDLVEAMPEVAAFVPVTDEAGILDVVERLTGVPAHAAAGLTRAADSTTATCPPRTTSGPSAYLQISDGCHRRCSYCTIPAIRGSYRSRASADIVEEARLLVSNGVREITLIGQDISSYGRDLSSDGGRRPNLADVVRTVARVDGLSWLRLMYVQPDGVTEELLEVMATEPAVCHYLDMPLQHASERVLRRMHRSGSAEEYLSLIERVRAAMPDVALRTSLIAGFPGEDRSDIAVLEQFLTEARIDYAGVFAYSPEEGTPAASMPDVPARSTRSRRANRLRELADRIGFEKAAEHIGDVLEVLVEGVDEEGTLVGRWRGQAPEVDGLVMLDRGRPGEFVSARVVDALGYDLEAEVI